MLVEINEVNISKDKITINAVNLEDILLSEDPFEEHEAAPVEFEFDRFTEDGGVSGGAKYLYKVCKSNRQCQGCKSIGEQISKLVGQILNLADGFVVKAEEEPPKKSRK